MLRSPAPVGALTIRLLRCCPTYCRVVSNSAALDSVRGFAGAQGKSEGKSERPHWALNWRADNDAELDEKGRRRSLMVRELDPLYRLWRPRRGRSHQAFFEQERGEKKPRGALKPREYDETHGRWWRQHKDVWAPKLFSTIGRHARSPGLKTTMLRWVYRTPNWRRLMRDQYRKRWPPAENMTMRFFAEFALKDFKDRSFLETACSVPLDGVGSKFWRPSRKDGPDTRGRYFVPASVEYKQRPFRGSIRGTEYMFGRPIRNDVAAMNKSVGQWRCEPPAGAHPSVFRPTFPPTLEERVKRESVEPS